MLRSQRLTLLCILVLSCSTPKENPDITIIIDTDLLPVDQIELSDNIDEIIVLPLETRAEVLVGTSNLIDQDKNNLFYYSNQNQVIYRFNTVGKFQNKIGTVGKGPGEYVRVRDMHILPESRILMVYDGRQKKMIQYSFEGDFIKEFLLPGSTGRFYPINHNTLAVHLGRMVNDVNLASYHDLVYCDLNGDIISRHFPHHQPLQFEFGKPFTRTNKDGSFFYMKQFDFNLYLIQDTAKPTVALKMDYGKYMGSYEDLNGPTIEDFAAYQREGKRSIIDQPYNNYDHLALINFKDRKVSMALINKKTLDLTFFGTDSLLNLGYYNGFPIHVPMDTYQEYFVTILEALDWHSINQSLNAEQKKKLSKTITGYDRLTSIREDDNPILVYYRFKN